MNWSQCYSGSNNVHPDFPPLMDDGRNFAILDTTLNNIKLKNNLVLRIIMNTDNF